MGIYGKRRKLGTNYTNLLFIVKQFAVFGFRPLEDGSLSSETQRQLKSAFEKYLEELDKLISCSADGVNTSAELIDPEPEHEL